MSVLQGSAALISWRHGPHCVYCTGTARIFSCFDLFFRESSIALYTGKRKSQNFRARGSAARGVWDARTNNEDDVLCPKDHADI